MFNAFKSKARSAGSLSGLNAAQTAGALAALEFNRLGNSEAAEKMLNRHGLTLKAAEAYAAAVRQEGAEAEETVDEPPAAPAHASTGGVERTVVAVPNGYADTVEQRAKLIALLWAQIGDGWQIESFDKEALNAVAVRGELPAIRPGEAVYGLSVNATASNGEASAIAHGVLGRTMLSYDFDPVTRTAQTAVLPPATVELRQRLLRKNPRQKSWELEILPLFSVQNGQGILDRVIITRADQHTDRMKAMAYWMEVARTVIGHSGWTVEINDKNGQVDLISGAVRKLPRIVPGSEFLPRVIDAKDWSSFVVGRNSIGEDVCIDLQAGPHSLVVGGTGSGKSVASRAIILNALSKGFEVVIIDPQKEAAGLLGIEPWTKGIFIKSVDEAAAALDSIYKEVRRRISLITSVRGENWMDLPAGTIKPMLVLLDEYSALITPDEKPPGLDSKHELMLEWAADAGARAKIRSLVGKIAKQARSVGVHLLIATQRPDAADIGGNVRDQLGTILQLIVPSKPPSPEALGMVFPKAFAASAMEEISLLNDGRSKGFALSYLEGGGVQGFRVGLVEKEDMAPYAEAMGIPLGVPLELAQMEPSPFSVVAPAPTWERESAEPVVKDLGEMTLDLGDLEMGLDGPEGLVQDAEEATEDEDEYPFGGPASSARVSTVPALDEDDPFAAPVKKKPAIAQVDDFWD